MNLIEKYLGEGSANYKLIFKDSDGNTINVIELKASSSSDAFDKAKMKGIKGAKKVDMVVKKRSIGVYDLSKKRLSEAKKSHSIEMECIECGHKFKKRITKSTIEVKCPKCKGYDTEVA